MNLYLRKVVHPQAHDNYRVVLKLDEGEFEIGSIGTQHGAAWRGIDTVIRMRVPETQGKGKNRRDCMKQFKAVWEQFAADEANLVEFLNAKRKRR
jgi:translation initiation factor 2 beta subunit (eIF-2beta)/eIF-5